MCEKSKEKFQITTPIIYILFNRPEKVRASFAAIRAARPKKLYIVADGPREGHPEDLERCLASREITEQIDWDCEVFRDYAEENLGCGKRPASGISWAFSREEQAIILEDDCVPSLSFFRFCQEMLEKYREDERVFSVSGMNYGLPNDNSADYFFSHYNNTLGWATWKRVWEQYDYEMRDFEEYRRSGALRRLVLSNAVEQYWYHMFEKVYTKELTTAWDYQFLYLSMKHEGLHIYPKVNLVQYLGFDEEATHVKSVERTAKLFQVAEEAKELLFPLTHPTVVQEDFRADCLRVSWTCRVTLDGQRLCQGISEKKMKVIREAKTVVLYGAGAVCQDVIRLLGQAGLHRFLVASTKPSPGQAVYGNPVRELEKLDVVKDDTLVVLTVSKKYEEEMLSHAKKLGYQHFLTLEM